MKIGYLLTYFHPFKDGTENQCLYLARVLAKRGHEIHVFTSDRRGGEIIKNKYEIYEGINIHRYRTLFRFKYYFNWNWKLMLDIMRADIDILLVHSIGFPQYDICLPFVKVFKKIPIVNFPHGPFWANETYPRSVKLLRELYRIFERNIVNKIYDAVIDCNGRQRFTWQPKYFPDVSKSRFIPDGMPADRYREINSSEFIKKYWLEGKFVIGQLGRLLKYKGQDQVIRALPAIVKKHPNVVFLCMGEDRGFLKELEGLASQLGVKANVIFTGGVSEDDKLRGLDASEIFVFGSMPGTEAFGITTLEAMARKCAVVSTKVEDGHPLIEQGVNGFVYEHGDIESLTKYLLGLIEDSASRKKMQELNFKRSKCYINENIALEFEALFRKLTGKA